MESYKLINSLNFCVFDLETTGGNHHFDKIIEIGLVKIRNLKITEHKNYLINPKIKIPEFIQKLTSITVKDVEDAPEIHEVIDEILNFIGSDIIVAHNVSFDLPFFNSELIRLGKNELTNKAICTNLMTKYLIPNLMNSNLNYMSRIFNIEHPHAHRALDDALATARLLIVFLKIFIEKNIKKLNHLYYPRGRYELDVCHFEKTTPIEIVNQKIKNLKTAGLVTIKGENGIILFSLPLSYNQNTRPKELDYLFTKINEFAWELITIKLHGPFIESLIHFGTLLPKIENDNQENILHFLWDTHLKKKYYETQKYDAQKYDAQKYDDSEDVNLKLGDFIITHHLVPEQFVIYPINLIGEQNPLIFRYPAHQKKLIQYINSKSSRLKNKSKTHKPIKNSPVAPIVKDFIFTYLNSINSHKNIEHLFVFDKDFALKKTHEFTKELENFLTQTPNLFNYPLEHV